MGQLLTHAAKQTARKPHGHSLLLVFLSHLRGQSRDESLVLLMPLEMAMGPSLLIHDLGVVIFGSEKPSLPRAPNTMTLHTWRILKLRVSAMSLKSCFLVVQKTGTWLF